MLDHCSEVFITYETTVFGVSLLQKLITGVYWFITPLFAQDNAEKSAIIIDTLLSCWTPKFNLVISWFEPSNTLPSLPSLTRCFCRLWDSSGSFSLVAVVAVASSSNGVLVHLPRITEAWLSVSSSLSSWGAAVFLSKLKSASVSTFSSDGLLLSSTTVAASTFCKWRIFMILSPHNNHCLYQYTI